MRLAVLALALALTSGCSLYFGNDHHTADDAPPPPPPPEVSPDATTSSLEYFCEGTTIYETFDGTRTHTMPVRTCPYGCRYTTFFQYGDPCLGAPPPVYACTESGACTANETDSCPATLQCHLVVSSGSCTCNAGTWSCQDACNQALCGAAAVQAAIAGDWTGTVTPPSFAQPYQIELHIGSDGLWSGTATGADSIPFYYGDNGNNLGSRIVIQAQTTVGAYASIGLFDGEVQGLITGLTVDAHHMRFAFFDSWLECGSTFYFDLTR